MTSLLLALAAFILLHSVSAIRPLRASLVSTFGRRTYLIGYSVVSLATLLWVFQAAFTVDYVPTPIWRSASTRAARWRWHTAGRSGSIRRTRSSPSWTATSHSSGPAAMHSSHARTR